MKVALITCWYRNLSTANYSSNLRDALGARVDIQIISSDCHCWPQFVGRKDVFQGTCRFATFPPYSHALDRSRTRGIFYSLVYLANLLLQFLRGITYIAMCKDCDIIHYEQTHALPFGIAPLYMLLSIPIQKKRIVTVHRFGVLSSLKFFSYAYRKADRIIVHSNDMQKKLLSFNVPASKIVLVPHGATLPPLQSGHRKEITFFGAPLETKGFLTILQALKLLRHQGRVLHLHIYGIYGEREKDKAVDEANRVGVSDLLVWGGRLSEVDFDRKMQESIFTLAPYSAATSGSSVVTRAMGNATPIIASTLGGIPEYLGGTGLMIPPNNPEALALAMIKLLDDPSLREKLSEEERKRAETFSWGTVAEETLNIYYQCIRER